MTEIYIYIYIYFWNKLDNVHNIYTYMFALVSRYIYIYTSRRSWTTFNFGRGSALKSGNESLRDGNNMQMIFSKYR